MRRSHVHFISLITEHIYCSTVAATLLLPKIYVAVRMTTAAIQVETSLNYNSGDSLNPYPTNVENMVSSY